MTDSFERASAVAIKGRSIVARDLSKVYRLYPDRSARLMEAIAPWSRRRHTDFRALDKVNFEVPRGATLGILGVNGSGKSTLLQIIGGIIQPSSGQVDVNGRVAALIELGAGFNPDMSGRENVRVNGVIMGLAQSAVDAQMDEIEAFADVGQFFDQPTKTYSSGMLARVAFAMAIHVDPDILIIDEALAVGDARFQQKCFRRFREFQEDGKTILLVTHDRFSVPRLCTHGLVLHRGQVVHFGDASRAAQLYGDVLANGDDAFSAAGQSEIRLEVEDGQAEQTQRAAKQRPSSVQRSLQASTEDAIAAFLAVDDEGDRCSENPLYNPNEHRSGDGAAQIIDLMLISGEAVNPTTIRGGETISIFARVRFCDAVEHPNLGISIKTKDAVLVFQTNAYWIGDFLDEAPAGATRVYKIDVDAWLGSGDWFIDIALASGTDILNDQREGVLHIFGMSKTTANGLVAFDTSISQVGDV